MSPGSAVSWFLTRCSVCSCARTLKGYQAKNGAKDKYHKNFLAVVERLVHGLVLGDALLEVGEVVAHDEQRVLAEQVGRVHG